jgi:hypothetical protein
MRATPSANTTMPVDLPHGVQAMIVQVEHLADTQTALENDGSMVYRVEPIRDTELVLVLYAS